MMKGRAKEKNDLQREKFPEFLGEVNHRRHMSRIPG